MDYLKADPNFMHELSYFPALAIAWINRESKTDDSR